MEIGEIIRKVIFFSNNIVTWVVGQLTGLGLPLNETQVSIIFFIVLLVLLLILVKFGESIKPWIKIAIGALIFWLILGFFYVPTK